MHVCLHPTPVYRLAPVWSRCVCRLSAGAHTRAHMRVGTCRYVWWDPGSYRQPTSGHKHTYTEQVCIPPGHWCALHTRVLCTLVCFTSCDTCIWGERRCVCSPTASWRVQGESLVRPCAVCGGQAVLGLGSAFRLLPVGSFSWSSQLLVSHRWCAF